MRYGFLAITVLLATLMATLMATMAGAQAPDGTAAFFDSSWAQLSPADVEQGAEFSAFSDVFDAKDLTEDWKSSEHYEMYDEPKPPRTLFDILSVLRGIRQTLAGSEAFNDAGDNGALIRKNLTLEIDQLIAATEAQGGGDPIIPADWEHVRQIVSMNRYQKEQDEWDASLVQGAARYPVSSKLVFFRRLPTQIVLVMDQPGDGLNPTAPFAYFATTAQAIEVRTVIGRILGLFNTAFVEQLAVTSERLHSLNRAWDNYLAKGFTQYPWEMLLNGHLTPASWNSPPSSQWILAHPEVAVVFDTRDAATARAETAIAIHGLGYLKYFGDERGWFLGLSGTASFTGSADFGLGYGPTLHVGSASTYQKVPHVSISVLWHDFGDGKRTPTFGINFDLWNLFSQEIGEEKFMKVVSQGI